LAGETGRKTKIIDKQTRENNKLLTNIKNLITEKKEAIDEKNVAKNAVSALTREIEWLQK